VCIATLVCALLTPLVILGDVETFSTCRFDEKLIRLLKSLSGHDLWSGPIHLAIHDLANLRTSGSLRVFD